MLALADRVGMRHVERKLRQRGVKRVVFLITAGGSMGGSAQDIANAKEHLSSASTHLHFSTADDPYVDFTMLRRCAGLVVSASSLGWWAAYLSRLPGDYIVAPRHLYLPHHKLARSFEEADYYPPGWMLLANDGIGSPNASRAVPSPRAADASHAALPPLTLAAGSANAPTPDNGPAEREDGPMATRHAERRQVKAALKSRARFERHAVGQPGFWPSLVRGVLVSLGCTLLIACLWSLAARHW